MLYYPEANYLVWSLTFFLKFFFGYLPSRKSEILGGKNTRKIREKVICELNLLVKSYIILFDCVSLLSFNWKIFC